jgi:hypothetical protein
LKEKNVNREKRVNIMSATLKLERRATIMELRRGTFDIYVDGQKVLG